MMAMFQSLQYIHEKQKKKSLLQQQLLQKSLIFLLWYYFFLLFLLYMNFLLPISTSFLIIYYKHPTSTVDKRKSNSLQFRTRNSLISLKQNIIHLLKTLFRATVINIIT